MAAYIWCMEKMCLANAKKGQTVCIEEIGSLDMKKRFLAFGFVKGVKLRVVRQGKNSMLVVRSNTTFAIDKFSASQIFVKMIDEDKMRRM